MRQFNLGDLTFELFDEIVYKDERNFIKISGSILKLFKIDYKEYKTDKKGVAIIDYSDIVKAYDFGEFTIYVDDLEQNVEWASIPGIKPIEQILPPQKLKICNLAEFYLFIHLSDSGLGYQVYYDGSWHNFPLGDGEILVLPNWTKLKIAPETQYSGVAYSLVYSEPYTRQLLYEGNYYFEFERQNCNCINMKQLTWVGENGKRKSYTFEVLEEKRTVSESIEFESINHNGFDVRKNFNLSFKLRTEKLNYIDRCYFSDLVSSSNVLLSDIYVKNAPVFCTNTSFTNPKNDEFEILNFDIKFKQYDTI